MLMKASNPQGDFGEEQLTPVSEMLRRRKVLTGWAETGQPVVFVWPGNLERNETTLCEGCDVNLTPALKATHGVWVGHRIVVCAGLCSLCPTGRTGLRS